MQQKGTEVRSSGTNCHAQRTLSPRFSDKKVIFGLPNSTHLRFGCDKIAGQESFSNFLSGTGSTSLAACVHPASSIHHPWLHSLSLRDCEHKHSSSSTANYQHLSRAYWAEDPASHVKDVLVSSPDGPWRSWQGHWTDSRWTLSGCPLPHNSISFQNVASPFPFHPRDKISTLCPGSLLRKRVPPRAHQTFSASFLEVVKRAWLSHYCQTAREKLPDRFFIQKTL